MVNKIVYVSDKGSGLRFLMELLQPFAGPT